MSVAATPSGRASPLVGREAERSLLLEAFARARGGQGSGWALTGSEGVGKTCLLHWIEAEARREGFHVLTGFCLREAGASFFAFDQALRGLERGAAEPPGGPDLPDLPDLPSVILVEEDRPRRSLELLSRLSRSAPTLVLSRDRPAALRQRVPDLPAEARVLWLTRSDGEDVLPPGQLDALGERADQHFSRTPGSIVALSGLEYLVSQNAFLPVLRLVQFLRDAAERTGGKLLLSALPQAFEPRELSLLEAEGLVVKPASAPAARESPSAAADEGPSARLLRYQERLEGACREGPVALLLDDVQWADPGSALALQFLARNLRRWPLALVVASRDTAGASGPAAETLENLAKEGALRRVPLGGLQGADLRALVEGALGAPLLPGPSEEVLAQVGALFEGNPQAVLEAVANLREGGHAGVEDGGGFLRWPSTEARPEVPSHFRRRIVHRLSTLPPDERDLLETAALMGSEFDLAPLPEALGRSRESVQVLVDRLADTFRLLGPADATGRRPFRPPWTAVVARESLAPEARKARAARLAGWYASRRPEGRRTVARLYHAAGDAARGLPWVREALVEALASGLTGAADPVVRELEDLVREPEAVREGALREALRCCETLREAGRDREARRVLQALLDRPLEHAARGAVERAFVDVLSDLNPAEARPRLNALERTLAAGETSDALRALVAVSRAHLATLSGSWEEGRREADRALDLLGPQGDAGEQSRALASKGWCLKQLGQLEPALEAFGRGRATAASLGRPGLLASHWNGEGGVALLRGDLPEALRCFQRSVEEAGRSGHQGRQAAFLLNVAEVYLNRSEFEAARSSIEEALRAAEQADSPRVAANAAFKLGGIDLRLGRWTEAERAFTSARDRYERLGISDSVSEARINLAGLQGIRGDPRAGLLALDDMVRRYGAVDRRNLPLLFRTRGDLRSQMGDFPGARAELERGLEASLGSENLLGEADLRQALADWEIAHGDAEQGRRWAVEARELYRRCGVLAPDLGEAPPDA